MTPVVIRLRIVLWVVVICNVMATALGASTNSAWFARVWQTDDGLPNNNVNALALTADGFLCVATPHGLSRFDGTQFEEISSTNMGVGAFGGVLALARNSSGGLWAQMDRGTLVSVNPDHATVATPANGLPDATAQTMLEGDDGTLWISYLGGALCAFKDNRGLVLDNKQGFSWGPVSSVAKDTKGRIWLARNGQVGIFSDGHFHPVGQLRSRSVRLAAAHSGGVWLCGGSQLQYLDEGEPLRTAGGFAVENSASAPSVLLEDSRGAVWVGTSYDGLFRWDGSRFEEMPVSHPEISSLLEDAEGNIWVGTHGGGLNRLRPRAITLENVETGLPFQSVQSVCEDTSGTIWAVTENGLVVHQTAAGWENLSTDADWPGGIVSCVAADPCGGIWIGTHNHRLTRYQNGRFENWSRSRGINTSPICALLCRTNGEVWIGGQNHALLCLRSNVVHEVPLPADARTVRAITEDALGNVWIGTSKGLLFRVAGDQAIEETTASLKSLVAIRCLWGAPDGAVWIGYAGAGLGRLKNGAFSQITTARGLSDNFISQVVPDQQGWLWIGNDRGISKVRLKELESAVDDPAARVRSVHYGRGEGLPSLQAAFGYCPNAICSRDGRILIPTRTALAIVHPEKLPECSRPPPTFVKGISLDEKRIAAYGGIVPIRDVMDLRTPISLQLPPDHRKLDVEFAALNFSAPENVRVQYRLEGFDGKWLEAGLRRSASYSRLAAGNYRFRIRASDNNGVWNETALALVVTPFLWQRWWFQPLVLAMLGGVAILIVRHAALRRLRSRLVALEQQAALDRERGRIARDLHDHLGSHLTKIILLSDLIFDYRSQPEKSGETAQRVSSTARQVVKALDETVWAVNPRNDTLPQLIDYIGQFAVEFLRTAGIRCQADLPLRAPEENVSTEVRHNLFLVAKEALNNVVSHAHATEVRLQIAVRGQSVRLVIEDNGRGFDQAPNNGSADGLRNMRQRVEEIGGHFTLESKAGAGTRISVTAPLMPRLKRPAEIG